MKFQAAPPGIRAMVRQSVQYTIIGLFLASLVAACGDAVVFFSVSFGTVAGNPTCGNGDGRFDLCDQQGLILVVFIDSDTQILAPNGHAAQCADIAPGAQVQVDGRREATTIAARSVQLL
jgi:hypothetical protein